MNFKTFSKERYDELLDMMSEFYTSDAVAHPIPFKTIKKLLDDIISQNYLVKGLEVYYEGNLVGFGITTSYYTSEVAGITVQLEDLYIQKEYRSKGIAKKYFNYIMNNNPEAVRFRLEVSPSNTRAIELYNKMGFDKLEYNQMIFDL